MSSYLNSIVCLLITQLVLFFFIPAIMSFVFGAVVCHAWRTKTKERRQPTGLVELKYINSENEFMYVF